MSDRFSFSRFEQVWQFYCPGIMRQWGWTAAAVAVLYMLALMARLMQSFVLYSVVSSLLVVPFYLGPIIFAVYRDRAMQVLIPASGYEKALFMLSYTLLILPLVMVAMWFSIEGFFGLFGVDGNVLGAFVDMAHKNLEGIGMDDVRLYSFQRLASEAIPALTCLYVVVSSRGQRVLKGICGIAGSLMALGFVGGVYGFFLGIKIAGLSGSDAEIKDAAAGIITDTVQPAIAVISVALAMAFVVGVVLTWRRILKVQV